MHFKNPFVICLYYTYKTIPFFMSAKKICFCICFVFICTMLKAQEFFEVKWKQDNVLYTGLLIYYNTDDAIMRVRYTIDGHYRVAEFKCQYKKMNMNGREGYILDGMDAKLVYGSGVGYSSDNFYFYKEGDGYGMPYTIDDIHLAMSNPSQYFLKVDSWSKIATSIFDEKFVRNYYEKEEPMYGKLLSYNVQMNKTDGGYRISTVAYGNTQWMVCMSKGTGTTAQSTYRETAFPADWIMKNWIDGKEITNVTYGDGQWLVVMSANTKITNQTYSRDNATFPDAFVKEKTALGYYISSVSCGSNGWFVVMSKGTGFTNQQYYTSNDFPVDWINQQWNNSYRINALAYGGGQWVTVMSQGTGITMQNYKKMDAYPDEFVKAKWNEQYEVTATAYGSAQWYVVMSQNTGITQQTYNVTALYPRDWVQNKWDGKSTAVYDNLTLNTNTVAPATKGQIYLVMVANTAITDIGTSCKVDEEHAVNEFSVFAKELNMPLNKHIIDGTNFNRASVDAELNAIHPTANDIVVFMYSGHGFRWTNQTSLYPSISLKYSSYERVAESNSYLLGDIYNKVSGMGARLSIIIGDCCNSSIGVSSRGGDFALTSRSGTNGNTSKLQQLFLNKKGTILIAAASPNETSCGNSRDGGYLTSSFFQAIAKETSYLNTDTPDWDRVIKSTIQSAKFSTQNLSGCTTQNGMYYSTVK